MPPGPWFIYQLGREMCRRYSSQPEEPRIFGNIHNRRVPDIWVRGSGVPGSRLQVQTG